MHRKICSIGNSQGLLLPKQLLEKLNINTGDEVNIELDEKSGKLVVEPLKQKTIYKSIDAEFASEVKDFIKQYKVALKALAE